MKKPMLAIAISALLAGCATAPLTQQEAAVKILRHSDPPSTCKELGKISSPGNDGLSSDQAVEDGLKRAAAALGGNTLTIESTNGAGTKSGTAFNCP